MLGLPKSKKKHVRTVSRFCDEANIGEEDELDLAEFILAAQYLGSEANDDQLMETFMEMEDNLTNKNPTEIIREVLKKVEEKYKIKEVNLKSSDDLSDEEDDFLDDNEQIGRYKTFNDEIVKTQTMDPFTEDLNWQNDQIGQMLNTSVQSSNLSIARNLLETTALTAKQISDLTSLPLNVVEELEEEFDDASDEEEETDRPLKKSEIKKQEKEQEIQTRIISSENFSKGLGITKTGIQSIDKILSGGKDCLKDNAETALELLKKFKIGISSENLDNTDKNQDFKKLRTELLSVQFTEKDKKSLTKTINKVENEKRMSKQGNTLKTGDKKTNQTDTKDTNINTISISIGTKKDTNNNGNKFPQQWRVVIHPGALAKIGEDVKSKISGKVEIGTVVTVEELKNRRARISKPIKGWVSTISSQGKVILEREGTSSKLMANAKAKERARQTKILILKSVTTLNEKTVERILIKSEWNLRRAIEAFYIAKFKTQEYIKEKEKKKQQKQQNTNKDTKTDQKKDTKTDQNLLDPNNNQDTKDKNKKGWFNSWKTFTKKN